MRSFKVRYTWDLLRMSFWFIPVVMSLAAILLVGAMNWVDERIPNAVLQNSRLVLSIGVDQVRGILVSMATTILATAGVVFTLLTLPLSTVAAQYGSLLLRLFLGDRTTQFVLGIFVGTFVYCLAAATSLPATVTNAQAPEIAAAAGAELLEVVQSEILDEAGNAAPAIPAGQDIAAVEKSMLETESDPVRVTGSGYIQYVDPEALLTLAGEKDLVIRLLPRRGAFLSPGRVVARVWPAGRIDQQVETQLRQAFRLGHLRTPTQDIEYAINQLVEMAVRAMSPAINDPYTAMTCLDYLGQGLALFAQKDTEASHLWDRNGKLRLVFEPVTFAHLLHAAFDMLRHCSCDNASVLLHMLEVIDTISQGPIAGKPPAAAHSGGPDPGRKPGRGPDRARSPAHPAQGGSFAIKIERSCSRLSGSNDHGRSRNRWTARVHHLTTD